MLSGLCELVDVRNCSALAHPIVHDRCSTEPLG
jgi:hypothetical protein